MAEVRRRLAASAGTAQKDGVTIVSDSSPTEVDPVLRKLRQRWELAAVLNFLHVFEPVIGSDLKISAEDLETALIDQTNTLAQLHIALLKGILPASQILKSPDAWVAALSKILSTWWLWVAKGEFPLTGAKGEEISVYKELEPTTRLAILRALCEVRADQYDAVDYVNELMKKGTEVSYFRKNSLACDGNRVTFWYDGSETIGHRLYKEVYFFENKRGKVKATVPDINCQWETLATNLEEFKMIMDEFSSSEVKSEAALSKSLEMDVIPVLEKQWKKKHRALLRQQREQKLLNSFRKSVRTRSCRNIKPVDYRFDGYDKAIKEAIRYTNKWKSSEEQKEDEKLDLYRKRTRPTSNGSDNSSTESDTEKSSHGGNHDSNDSSDEEHEGRKKDDDKRIRDEDQGTNKQTKPFVKRPKGLRFSKRLAGIPGHTVPESMNVGAKNRLRQRPSVNTAVESAVVADSEDECLSGDTT